MTGKLITLALASALLSGCVSLSSYNIVQRTEALCKERFTYKVFSPLNISSDEALFFRPRGAFIPDWAMKHQIVIYDETSELLYTEKNSPEKIEEVRTRFYSLKSNERIAEMVGIYSYVSVSGLMGQPRGYGCGWIDTRFLKELKGFSK